MQQIAYGLAHANEYLNKFVNYLEEVAEVIDFKSMDKVKPEDEEDLMVTGKFDCGFNANGVRSWTFKGYRKARKPSTST